MTQTDSRVTTRQDNRSELPAAPPRSLLHQNVPTLRRSIRQPHPLPGSHAAYAPPSKMPPSRPGRDRFRAVLQDPFTVSAAKQNLRASWNCTPNFRDATCPCENYNSRPLCAAPTVLRILVATVPSPPGLGYVLSRLRRHGHVAAELEISAGYSRLVFGNPWLGVFDS
jgi:hypothetical protein